MDQSEFILSLYRNKIFKVGNFTLKSGKTSPFYIDLRLIPSYPQLFHKTIEYYISLCDEINNPIGAFAGMISAGVPFATGISLSKNIPLLQIRKKSKNYGLKNLIEGYYEGKNNVVLVDDLISTGASKMDALKALEAENYPVNDILVLIDRRKNTSQMFRDQYHLRSAFTIDDIVSLLERNKYKMDKKELDAFENSIENWKEF